MIPPGSRWPLPSPNPPPPRYAAHMTRVILPTVATCTLVLAFCAGRWAVTSATPTEPALVSVEQAPTQTPSPDAWVHKLPDLSHDPQRQRATGTADAHAGERDDARLALCLAQKGGSDEAGRDVNRRSSNQDTGGGTRTHTGFNSQRILNPPRLPIPPHRRVRLLRDCM